MLELPHIFKALTHVPVPALPFITLAGSHSAGSTQAQPVPTDLRSIGRLFPYLWEFRGRVLIALALLIGAKLRR